MAEESSVFLLSILLLPSQPAQLSSKGTLIVVSFLSQMNPNRDRSETERTMIVGF